MSAEIARAFCVRMMSDEDFRNSLGTVKAKEDISKILADEEYSFTRAELEKVIAEFVGKKLEPGELETLVEGFYEEQISAGNTDACKVVVEWISSLA